MDINNIKGRLAVGFVLTATAVYIRSNSTESLFSGNENAGNTPSE